MKNKITVSLIIFFFSAITAFSQAKIEFEAETHNFGEIPEGPVARHEFKFKNIGNAPLILSGVNASCGCTTPTWTKEPIKPGETGVIVAEYDSRNRPGAFNKSISVWSNAENGNKVLYIKGSVTNIAAELQNSNQTLIAENKEMILGKMERGKWVPFTAKLKSPEDTKVLIVALKSNCNCIRLDPTSQSLVQPGAEREVKFQLLAQKIGEFADELTLLGANSKELIKLSVKGEIVENLGAQSLLKTGGN